MKKILRPNTVLADKKTFPTFINVDFQDLLLTENLAPCTGFTAISVTHALALTLTRAAHGGHLLHHAKAQLVESHLHACTPARGTHFQSSFSTPSA